VRKGQVRDGTGETTALCSHQILQMPLKGAIDHVICRCLHVAVRCRSLGPVLWEGGKKVAEGGKCRSEWNQVDFEVFSRR